MVPCAPRVCCAFSSQPISHSRLGRNAVRLHGIMSQFAPQITQSDAQKVHRVLILSSTPNVVNQLTGITPTNTFLRPKSTLRSETVKTSSFVNEPPWGTNISVLAISC